MKSRMILNCAIWNTMISVAKLSALASASAPENSSAWPRTRALCIHQIFRLKYPHGFMNEFDNVVSVIFVCSVFVCRFWFSVASWEFTMRTWGSRYPRAAAGSGRWWLHSGIQGGERRGSAGSRGRHSVCGSGGIGLLDGKQEATHAAGEKEAAHAIPRREERVGRGDHQIGPTVASFQGGVCHCKLVWILKQRSLYMLSYFIVVTFVYIVKDFESANEGSDNRLQTFRKLCLVKAESSYWYTPHRVRIVGEGFFVLLLEE